MIITRMLWTLLALALLAFGIIQSVAHGWVFGIAVIAAAIAPDLALIGAFDPERPGRLRPSRVRVYNLAHTPGIPLALMLVGALTSAVLFVFAGAWLMHIAFDRAFGYGLRRPDGSIRPVGEGSGGRVGGAFCQP